MLWGRARVDNRPLVPVLPFEQTRRLDFLKLPPLAYLEDISDQPGLSAGLFAVACFDG
jgi:hypothetical protein